MPEPSIDHFAGQQALDNIRIVLVNTTHPGNIGATARAMKNMGLSQLYLVAPKDYPSEEAVWRSGHALDTLDGAIVTDTLDEALEGCGMVIGTSARERKVPWPLLNPRESAATAIAETSQYPVAIVFGREDRGLTNEELQKCHLHLNIPTNEAYSSLNLAAAVQVVGYELRMAAMGDGLHTIKANNQDAREWEGPPASAAMMEHFYQQLEQVLIAVGFLNPDNPRQTMTRLRRLFTRVRMDEMEASLLMGIFRNIRGGKQ